MPRRKASSPAKPVTHVDVRKRMERECSRATLRDFDQLVEQTQELFRFADDVMFDNERKMDARNGKGSHNRDRDLEIVRLRDGGLSYGQIVVNLRCRMDELRCEVTTDCVKKALKRTRERIARGTLGPT